jgi:hypothetical protein
VSEFSISRPFLGLLELDLTDEASPRHLEEGRNIDTLSGGLRQRAGVTLETTLGDGPIRGIYSWGNVGTTGRRIVVVSGTGLWLKDVAGDWTLLGSPFSAGRSVAHFVAHRRLLYVTDGENPLVVTDGVDTFPAMIERPPAPTTAASPTAAWLQTSTLGSHESGSFGYRVTWYSPDHDIESMSSEETVVDMTELDLKIRIPSGDAPADTRFTKFRVYRRGIAGQEVEWYQLFRPGTPHTDFSFDTDYVFSEPVGLRVDEVVVAPPNIDLEDRVWVTISQHGPIMLGVAKDEPETVYFTDAIHSWVFVGGLVVGSVGSADDVLAIHSTEGGSFVQKERSLYLLTGFQRSEFQTTIVGQWSATSRGGQAVIGSTLYSLGPEGLRVSSDAFEDSILSRNIPARIAEAVDWGDVHVFSSKRLDLVGILKRCTDGVNAFLFRPRLSETLSAEVWNEWSIAGAEIIEECQDPVDGMFRLFLGDENGRIGFFDPGSLDDWGEPVTCRAMTKAIDAGLPRVMKVWQLISIEMRPKAGLANLRVGFREGGTEVDSMLHGVSQTTVLARRLIGMSSRSLHLILETEERGGMEVEGVDMRFQGVSSAV